MDNLRWWHVAIVAIAVVLTGMIVTAGIPTWRAVGAQVALTVFVVGWFTIGRLAWRSQTAAIVFTGIVIVTTGTAVGFFPFMAIMQCIAYPLVWVLGDATLRRAVIANVLLALAVGVGFWLQTNDPLQTLLTAGLSLGFSLALGLWISRIAELSEERQALIDELHRAQSRLSVLDRDAGIASERERLAREIHDTIAQDLTALVMLTERSRTTLASGDTAGALSQLEMVEESARSALAETRALVAATAPVGLASGIHEALDRLAERFSRETGVTVGVEVGDLGALDRDTEVVLLRVAQEGLANVRKHAKAQSAVVELDGREGTVSLTVRDDGAGFDPSATTRGYGLTGMRDRLALVGGSLDVASSPTGTALTATLPAAATS